MKNMRSLLITAAGLTILAGCTRTVAPLESVSPLPAAPSGTVQQQTLEPVNVTPDQSQVDGQDGTQVATATDTDTSPVPSAVSSEPVNRGSVAGVWDVQVAGGTCKFATSFTRRSQHYQASALRCPSPELSGVREWDVAGNQLVLYDQSGAAVARLFKTAENRFDGKTTGGTAVTFSRS
mgnify:CR=1 FL=1